MYGTVDCNGHVTGWLCQECYSNERVLPYTILISVHRRLRKSGSSHMKSLVCNVPIPSVEDLIAGISAARNIRKGTEFHALPLSGFPDDFCL
ncbi:hypothetical protein TNCV_2380061 [Trichonephila clavipes]|nr:hypothetical protein TNCV_2380061 [Trichonephila clavipes]